MIIQLRELSADELDGVAAAGCGGPPVGFPGFPGDPQPPQGQDAPTGTMGVVVLGCSQCPAMLLTPKM